MLKPSQNVRKVVMVTCSLVPHTEPGVVRHSNNTEMPNFPCAEFPTESDYESGWRPGAQMRPKIKTMLGASNGHHSLPGACSRLFSRSQSYKGLGGDAAGSRLFGRKNRGPLLSGNAVSLPPFRYGWLANGHVGCKLLQGGPQTDNVTERAKISHALSLRTIGPKTQGQTGLRLRKMFRTSCPHG